MAVVTLTEDTNQQVYTKTKKGKGFQEILYFPKVPKDLEAEAREDKEEDELEEIWALNGKQYDLFITEIEKYDKAAENLQAAQEKFNEASSEAEVKRAQEEVAKAQKAMHSMLIKSFGKKENDELTPIPQGAAKGLIECIGFVNKRTFYISKADLQKVENVGSKRKKFRFETDISKSLEDTFKAVMTDSNRGQADEKLKNKFMTTQVDIKKEWKIAEKKAEGQAKLKRLKVVNPIVDFLLTDDTCDIIDNAVKYFNETASFAFQQKEQKLEEVKGLLSKKDEEFTHYDWGKTLIGIQEIWNKTKPEFVEKIKQKHNEFPVKEKKRKEIIEELYQEPLPEVGFDASGGARFMRYSATAAGKASFDFAKGNLAASFGADAKLSLFEAGAEFNKYFPHNNGWKLAFKAPVKEECFEPKHISSGNKFGGDDPVFAHNSSFILPSSVFDVGEQLRGLAIAKNQQVNKELLIQLAGYADTTGADDYNKEISYRRAKALHALFADDRAQWKEYFDRGIWGTEERDMMKLTTYMLRKYPKVFKERFIHMKIADEAKLKQVLLKELSVAVLEYNYDVDNIETTDIKNQMPQPIVDGNKFTYVEEKKSTKELIRTYQTAMQQYLLSNVSGIKKDDFNLFYIDTELYPILSYGETNLKVAQEGRIAANRRVTLEAWGVKRAVQTVEKEINLGDGRFKIHGQVSCFVGATIGVSAVAELNTYKGTTQLIGKRNPEDTVAAYDEHGFLKEDEKLGSANATAKVEAFAGAKAEASLCAALEWKNPEKKTGNFGLLASVGGAVTGTAGAGIEGEFKIGFDQESKTFQIKMKAQATWGLGGGGAWCFTVGVQQLYDFIVLVYHKLAENDFNFIDIFEGERDKNEKFTESRVDVYEVYLAWISKLWAQKDYFKAGAAVLVGSQAVGAFSLLQKVDILLEEYKANKMYEEEAINTVNNIVANSEMLKFVPPKVKGRMLFMLTKYKTWSWSEVWDGDPHKRMEAAAVTLIKNITHAREWQEVMEHMAVKNNNGDFEPYEATKKHYKNAGNITRMNHSTLFLRNELLDETEDWVQVRKHVTNLPEWDKAWNQQVD